ncbi:MAG: uracil-DNA glycosylase [Planctomycetota bacterium]
MSGQLSLFDSGQRDLLSIRDYGEFKRELEKSVCTRCGLSEARNTIVVDRGDPGARIMAIGEGPGAEEDAQGRAFVGRGGMLFDQLMGEADFDTNRDLLIANIVKCRPPENRVPRSPEAEACLPFLRHQIALVKPKVIVLLGATALRFLLPSRKSDTMKDIVGKPFTDGSFPDVTFLVFYHPAFLLRDPRKLPDARGHIKTLRGLLG